MKAQPHKLGSQGRREMHLQTRRYFPTQLWIGDQDYTLLATDTSKFWRVPEAECFSSSLSPMKAPCVPASPAYRRRAECCLLKTCSHASNTNFHITCNNCACSLLPPLPPICVWGCTTSASLSQTQHWPAPPISLCRSFSPSPTSAEQYSTLKNASCHQVLSPLLYRTCLPASQGKSHSFSRTEIQCACIDYSIKIRSAQHQTSPL